MRNDWETREQTMKRHSEPDWGGLGPCHCPVCSEPELEEKS